MILFQEPPVSTSRKSGWTRRCASLRQTRSPPQQNSMEFNTNSSITNYSDSYDKKSPHSAGGITVSNATPVSSLPRKAKWEVIEHFNDSKGRGSVSSSLIAAGVTRCNLDGSIESANCGTPVTIRDHQHQILGENKTILFQVINDSLRFIIIRDSRLKRCT